MNTKKLWKENNRQFDWKKAKVLSLEDNVPKAMQIDTWRYGICLILKTVSARTSSNIQRFFASRIEYRKLRCQY